MEADPHGHAIIKDFLAILMAGWQSAEQSTAPRGGVQNLQSFGLLLNYRRTMEEHRTLPDSLEGGRCALLGGLFLKEESVGGPIQTWDSDELSKVRCDIRVARK